MKKPRRGDVIEVEWVDSRFVSLGWNSVGAYRDQAELADQCFTAGYVLRADRDRVVLASSISPGNRNVADATVVPRVAILSQHVLGRSTKRVRKALR